MRSTNLHVGGLGLRAWLPAILTGFALFAASSIPGRALPRVGLWNADKLVHCASYAVLGAAFAFALARSRGVGGARLVAVAAALGIAFGATDELHQLLVPGRSPDWRDLVSDAIGALAGALAFARMVRARERRSAGAS